MESPPTGSRPLSLMQHNVRSRPGAGWSPVCDVKAGYVANGIISEFCKNVPIAFSVNITETILNIFMKELLSNIDVCQIFPYIIHVHS